MATGPAVSVRRMRGPSDNAVNPAASTAFVSLVGQSAFGADDEEDASPGRRPPKARDRRPCAGQHDPHRRVRQGDQPVRERRHRLDVGDAIAPALFRGRDRDFLPVRAPSVRTLARETRHAARQRERDDRGRAELDRLLDGPVHPVSRRETLRDRHGPIEFGFACVHADHLRLGFGLACDHELCRVLAAAAVEQRQAIALPQSQRAQRVARRLAWQGGGVADRECNVDVEARDRHGCRWV